MNILSVLTTIFGTAMSFGYFLQTYKIFKRKSAKDVSLWTYLFFTAGISLWLAYGLVKQDYPIIISNIVFLIGAISVIIAYFMHKH